MELSLNIKETLRYLGVKGEANQNTLNLIRRCGSELLTAVSPKHVYKTFPLKLEGFRITVGEGFSFENKALARNLEKCSEVALFAATLGLGSGRLLQKYIHTDVAAAAVAQAAAAALIEDYCDACQQKIEDECAQKGLYVRPRFSPGYGDLPLSLQKDLIQLIDAQKYAGLYLTETFVMIPEKSVTAFMGLSPLKLGCVKQGCEACSKTDCLYRRG